MGRILIVDDEKDVLFLVKLILSREGYEVNVSLNAEGLREIITHSPPDIILLDIVMNGIDGCQICRQLKANPHTEQIAVILFSANHNIEQMARDCGADDCLIKPFSLPAAREKFKRFLKSDLTPPKK
jgi:CheY-like chemotaxis protein